MTDVLAIAAITILGVAIFAVIRLLARLALKDPR